MAPDDDRLAALVSAVADGRPVDWESLLAAARDEGERGLIRQLQILARINQGADERLPQERPMWGPLEVFEELGRGAYGRVYRARDPKLDREVALKLLDGTVSEERFLREAQTLARIRHAHIVTVHGADVFDGAAGIWMELVRGRSLEATVREQGPFNARETALIGMDLCAALTAVHGTGLRHRDIKAHNVMREAGGRIVLMDFGTGRPSQPDEQTLDASVTGTPVYMAPELFDGAAASVVTDLYALGVLLFFLATGEYPVAGTSLGELRQAHARGARRRLREARADAPALFAQVVDRALSPDPAGRFVGAAEMEQALAATLQVAHPARESGDGARGWRAAMARPLPAWAMIGALGLAVPGAFLAGRWIRSAPDSAAAIAKPGPLTADQWQTIESQQEMAGMLADRGDWSQSATHYDRMQQLLSPAIGRDEPFRAHALAKLGWAQLKAGQSTAARDNLALGLFKLEQEAGRDHPLRATISMAVAEEHHSRGDLAAAGAAVIQAVSIRQAALATACGISAGRSLDPERLTAALQQSSPSQDLDGDWIPDAIERVVGLDASTRDSDGDSLSDDEEDSAGDGVLNGLVWAIVPDPAQVLVHFANIDPEREGHRKERTFTGQAAPPTPTHPRAWRLIADPQGHYYQRLTSTQKQQAMARGWRLLSCGALWHGISGVNVDMTPLGARFDQNFLLGPDGSLSLLLLTSVMPREATTLRLGPAPGAWPATESVYEPGVGVRVNVGGQRHANYGGHRQFQENFGLFFAANDNIGAAPRGEVDVALVLLQIR